MELAINGGRRLVAEAGSSCPGDEEPDVLRLLRSHRTCTMDAPRLALTTVHIATAAADHDDAHLAHAILDPRREDPGLG